MFENVNFTVPPGAVVGIVGPNGAGKTTLFKMIVEAAGCGATCGSNSQNGEKPDGGTIRIGETVKIAYVDQSLDRPTEDGLWKRFSHARTTFDQ